MQRLQLKGKMGPLLIVLFLVFLWLEPCTTIAILLLAIIGHAAFKK